ncbi:hypothetical protein CkaCkLH20_03938 [Colletotrichum karsti]|uniref:Protein kinase domain-containing protein n=1 Tax=Colletotrichum karsti TaxID=1095194 RepID=A0A9P6LMR0_9PEZI|nr:uncharacterized protein CkaCkLH20_03938 [Colletotrichum karsti]KAF9878446.1 hypothetical protein CkaCkLH20_03938 [Colletotrichum karsti]
MVVSLEEDVAGEFETFVKDYINLHNCFGIDYHDKRRSFIPQPALAEFWSTEKLSHVLSKVPGIQTESWNGAAVEDYLAVFSVLVLLRRHETFGHFTHAKLNDQKLPLTTPEDYQNIDPQLEAILPEFIKLQWQFCPFSFDNGSGHIPRHLNLQPDIILPILRKVRLNVSEHSYQTHGLATIYKAELHPLCGRPADTVVLKEYHEGNEHAKKLHEAERSAYAQVQSSTVASIKTCYESFELCGRNTLVLEYAPGGTLRSTFEEDRPPVNDWQRERFWTRIFGLLDGLSAIHKLAAREKLKGSHGFVRPQSVMICGNVSKDANGASFKFADMGSSYFSERVNYAQRESHGTVPGVDTSRTIVGDLQDFGAILSEALIWSVFGETGRIAYKKERIANTQLRVFDVAERWHNRTIEATGGVAKALSRLILELVNATGPSQIGNYTSFLAKWKSVAASLRTDNIRSDLPGNRPPCWPRSTQPFMLFGQDNAKNIELDGVTDSGYHTLSRGDGPSTEDAGTTNMDFDDNATIMTNNEALNLTPDEKDQGVNEFAGHLYNAVKSDLDVEACNPGPGRSMLSLLKAFSVKLAAAEPTDDAKYISTFVRAHRK